MREVALQPSAAGTRVAPPGVAAPRVDDIDLLRSHEYVLLATLLARAPTPDFVARLATLPADDSPLGRAHAAIAEAAQRTDPVSLEREFFDLFIGVGRGELLPYASYYLTGFLNERPLALIREDLAALGLERVAEQPEPEDHIASLFEVMAGLACGRFATDAALQRQFFERHLKPWAGRFFKDLEAARSARFYRAVGALGRAFVEIEAEALTMD